MSCRQLALLVSIALAALACDDFKRLKDCQRLADTANPLLTEVERSSEKIDGGVPSPRTYRVFANRYAQIKERLDALSIGSLQVKEARDGYDDLLSDAKRELLRLSESVKSDHSIAQRKHHHRQALAPVLHKEQLALQRLKTACRP